MTHPGPDLALLLLGSYRKLVDQAVRELNRRGYPDVTPTLLDLVGASEAPRASTLAH